jgi:hypothetical protein
MKSIMKSILKSSIKRGLALAAVAASGCALGLLAPASAAADDAAHYVLESASTPGGVLTALPYGPISIVPRGATPGQVWDLVPSRDGLSLVNRDNGLCLSAPYPQRPAIAAPCGQTPGQNWRQIGSMGTIARFLGDAGCLSGDYNRVYAGDCSDAAAVWRLIPVVGDTPAG